MKFYKYVNNVEYNGVVYTTPKQMSEELNITRARVSQLVSTGKAKMKKVPIFKYHYKSFNLKG